MMSVPNLPLLSKLSPTSQEITGLERWTSVKVSHFYWSMATCNCNAEELVERFKSIMHYIVHKHHFPFKDFTGSVHKRSAQKMKIEIKSGWLWNHFPMKSLKQKI